MLNKTKSCIKEERTGAGHSDSALPLFELILPDIIYAVQTIHCSGSFNSLL